MPGFFEESQDSRVIYKLRRQMATSSILDGLKR
jgi:hypothetical protein